MLKVFDKNSVNRNEKVIIYGAAMYGDLAFNALRELGIAVYAFCDRVQAGKELYGILIISPEQLAMNLDAHVLICATKGFQGIKNYLEEINWENYYEITNLLEYVNYDKLDDYCKCLSKEEIVSKYRFYIDDIHQSGDRIDLSFVALSITERCSLKCEKCSVLVPYYKCPLDEKKETILGSFEKFLCCVDSIAELQIGGGEPFMHTQLNDILKWCVKQQKIKEISIFTNSTIIPNKELVETLKNNKIKLLLDDYGALSKNLNTIIDLCNRSNIRYLIQKFSRWDDLGDFSDKSYSEEAVEKLFRYCSFGNVISFMKGKLYRCTTAARIADLELVPDDKNDYVDFNVDDCGIEIWRNKINQLLYEKKYHMGCKKCNGISTNKMGIPVAKQMKRT